VPTGVSVNDTNRRYLMSKIEIAGHHIRDMEDLT
jgi:hypothetical protein